MGPHALTGALRSGVACHRRTYLLLTGGRIVSRSGSNISGTFALLILTLTRFPALAELAGVLAILPTVLLNLQEASSWIAGCPSPWSSDRGGADLSGRTQP